MLQTLQALQASTFASMSHSSSASGGSDPSSILFSEQQQFSLPPYPNSSYFANSPPRTIGLGTSEVDMLAANPNNPHICVTNVIGDEVLVLGGGKSTPSASVPTETGIHRGSTDINGGSAMVGDDGSLIRSTTIICPSFSTSASSSKSADVEPMDMDESS